MKIYDLRTEYRENPAGLAAAVPRFSWKMKTDEKNTMQDLYRIEMLGMAPDARPMFEAVVNALNAQEE